MPIVGLRPDHPFYDDDLEEARALRRRFAAAKGISEDEVDVVATYVDNDEIEGAVLEAIVAETRRD